MTEAWDVHQKTAAEGAGYGDSMGQLGAMKEGDHSIAITSPPYAAGCRQTGGLDPKPHYIQSGNKDVLREYGASEGQLGAMPEGQLCVSSPPYAAVQPESSNRGVDYHKQYETYCSQGGGASFEKFVATQQLHSQGYGSSAGQLSTLREGSFDAVVSSPPYEGSVNREGEWHKSLDPQKNSHPQNRSREYIERNQDLYGPSANNLGNQRGETFWSASRLILEQLHQVIVPGGHAVFVVKAFVRDKQIVDFPAQWAQLCEAVGFRLLHHHRASLVEHSGTQRGFEQDREIQVERKSFFRRLAEKKGSPRIDHESVLCLERQ